MLWLIDCMLRVYLFLLVISWTGRLDIVGRVRAWWLWLRFYHEETSRAIGHLEGVQAAIQTPPSGSQGVISASLIGNWFFGITRSHGK
jgi:hypothetical protein